MSSAPHFTSATTLATRRAGLTSAPLPTITLLLSIGSLPLPLRDQYTG
jgi:hypothetical protein